MRGILAGNPQQHASQVPCGDARCWRVRPGSAYHATGWGCGPACAASWRSVIHTLNPSSAWRRRSAEKTPTSARNAGELSFSYLVELLMRHNWTLVAKGFAMQHAVTCLFQNCPAELSAGAHIYMQFCSRVVFSVTSIRAVLSDELCLGCRYELQESKMLSMSTRRHEYGRQTRDEAAEVSNSLTPHAFLAQ